MRSAWLEKALARFEKHYEPEPNTGCWLWTARLTGGGYGHFRVCVAGVAWSVPAHRWLYEVTVSQVPPKLHLDHLCRQRSCVNPAHLQPVTPRENVLRGVGPCAANAKLTACRRGHAFTPENTGFENGGRRRRCRTCDRDQARILRGSRLAEVAS